MPSTPLTSLRVGLVVWLFGVFSYFLPAATWNPVSRFALTRAIVEERTLSIDSFAEATGDRAFYDGKFYSDKAPIPSLVAVPVYAAFHAFARLQGEAPQFAATGTPATPAVQVTVNRTFQRGLYVCSLSTAALAGAALGLVLFELLRARTSLVGALFGASATVLGTPLMAYSTSFYGHAIAGAFLLGAVLAADSVPAWSAGRLRIAGACLASSAGCEYIVAAPALVVAIGILVASDAGDRRRAALCLLQGAALPIAIVAAYHTACFGAPWRTAYSYIPRPEFARGHASGFLGIHPPRLDALIGLLFGPRRGLFFVSPLMLAAVGGGLAAILRARSPMAVAGAVATSLLVLLNAGYYMWWGGAAAGPRHLVPVMGFGAFGLAALWEHRAFRAIAVVLALISTANMLALTGVGLEAPDRANVLFEYAWPLVLQGRIGALSGASNLAIELGFARAATLSLVVAWIFLGLYHLMGAALLVEPAESAEK